MIDPKLFTVEDLLRTFLDTQYDGGRNKWWEMCEIIPNYMPPYPRSDTKPTCVVAIRDTYDDHYSFLRHSIGPRQGHFWDIYGDDYFNPSLALLALMSAPVPPWLLDKKVWG